MAAAVSIAFSPLSYAKEPFKFMAVIKCLSYLIVPYRSLSALWLAAYLTFSYLSVHLAFIILSGKVQVFIRDQNHHKQTMTNDTKKLSEKYSAQNINKTLTSASELATLRTHCAVGLASLLKHFTVILQCFFNFSRIHTLLFSHSLWKFTRNSHWATSDLRSMFAYRNSVRDHNIRDTEAKLVIPKPRTDYLKDSFS